MQLAHSQLRACSMLGPTLLACLRGAGLQPCHDGLCPVSSQPTSVPACLFPLPWNLGPPGPAAHGSPLHTLLSDPALVWAVCGTEDQRRLDAEFEQAAAQAGHDAHAGLGGDALSSSSSPSPGGSGSGSGSDTDAMQSEPASPAASSGDPEPSSAPTSGDSNGADGTASSGSGRGVFGGLVVDVQVAAQAAGHVRMALAALAGSVLGYTGLNKTKSMTRSNWSGNLSLQQIR